VRREGLAENTPAAFAAAAREGARWVELDARRSADGVPVVYHNGWTPDGVPVVDRSTEELAAVGVYSLADILGAMPAGMGVNVEVKNLPGEPDYDPDDAVVETVAAVMARHQGDRSVFYSSFNPLTVQALGSHFPAEPVGLIHYEGIAVVDAIELALEAKAAVLAPHVDAPGADAGGVEAAHAAGLEVMVWTVNDVGVAQMLAAAGADAICTDAPATMLEGLAATPPA
jgi:glycerophosphoryl diester phosphodiesterase